MSTVSDRIDLLSSLIRIFETGSLSAAARSLGVTQPTVSRQLSQLESKLGTRLVERTTHSLTFTPEGLECVERARNLLAQWEALAETAQDPSADISGPLHLIAPIALGRLVLPPILAEFRRKHPGISLTLNLTDQAVDLHAEGADALIKAGPLHDETLIARDIAVAERIICAAPEVFGGNKHIESADALESSPWVSLRPFYDNNVSFIGDDGPYTLTIDVAFATNDIGAAHAATLAGMGLALLPRWMIQKDIADGKLIHLGEQWRGAPTPIRLAYPVNRYRTRRLKALLEELKLQLPQHING